MNEISAVIRSTQPKPQAILVLILRSTNSFDRLPNIEPVVTSCVVAMTVYSFEPFASITKRRLRPWTGLALLGNRAANCRICSGEASIGSRKTVQVRPSEHGGVVSEPM